jgi:hypothetical protein
VAGQLRKGDVGSILRITVKEAGLPFNASQATAKTLKFKKPSGVIHTVVPAFETTGQDGVLVYTTVAGDLDQSGPWTAQVYLAFADGQWHTEPFSVVVGESLGL